MNTLFDSMIDWIQEYYGNIPFLIPALLGYVYFSIISKDFRKKLLFPLLLLVIVLMVPTLYQYLYVKTRYWRWFWMVPNSYITAAAVVSIIRRIKKNWVKGICLAVCIGAIVLGGDFIYSSDVFVKTQNLYKIDQEYVDICEAIVAENPSPLCILDANIHMRGRQVAGNILTLYGRDANGYIVDDETVPFKRELYTIIRDLPEEPNYEFVLNAAKERNVDFITLQKPRAIPDDLQRTYNYRLFYETQNYYVYQHKEESWGYDRVIMIGVAGAEDYFKDVSTPAFDRIFADGNVTYQMTVPSGLSSQEGWASILYGADCRLPVLLEETLAKEYHVYQPLENLFSLVKNHYPEDPVGVIVSSEMLRNDLFEQEESIYYYPTESSNSTLTDEEIVAKVKEWASSNDPRFLFVELDSVEEAGLAYLEAIRQVDESIGELYDFLVEQGLMDNTLFIVTTEHGGLSKTSGSADETGCMFAVKGTDVITDSEIKGLQPQDIAPVILYALNIEKPSVYSGRLPKGIWKGFGKEDRNDCLLVQAGSYRGHVSSTPAESIPEELSDRILYENNCDTERTDLQGSEYLVPGYFGNAFSCVKAFGNTGMTSMDFGYKYSVSFWIRADEITGDPVIMTNKDWSSGKNCGFLVAHWKDKILVNLADEKGNRCDFTFPLPSDYREGWTHFIFTFDLEKRKVTGYCDFNEIYSRTIPDQLDVTDLMTENTVMIAQDITGVYHDALTADLDEVVVFKGILSREEIEVLKNYYTDQEQ